MKIVLCIALEVTNDAVRNQTVSPLLIRAGIDPLDCRQVSEMRDFIEQLQESV